MPSPADPQTPQPAPLAIGPEAPPEPDAAPLDLDAIEARAEEAQSGPWTFEPYKVTQGTKLAGSVQGKIHSDGFTVAHHVFESDAPLLEHAREDVLALVARVRKLEAIVAAWDDRWVMNGAWIAAVGAGERQIAARALAKRIEAEDRLRALGIDP